MEASRIRALQMHGSQMGACLNREKPQPIRNHMKENVLNYRQKAQELKSEKVLREEEDRRKKVEGPWKMREYRGASSKVVEYMGGGSGGGNSNLNSRSNSVQQSGINTPAVGRNSNSKSISNSYTKNAPSALELAQAAAKARRGQQSQQNQIHSNINNNQISQSESDGVEVQVFPSGNGWGDADSADSYNNPYMNEYGGGSSNDNKFDNNLEDYADLGGSGGDGFDDGSNLADLGAGDLDLDDFMAQAEALKKQYGGTAKDTSTTSKVTIPGISNKSSITRDNRTKVPVYLQKMKKKREAEQQKQLEEHLRRKSEPPPGYRVLSEDERVETLNALLEKQKEMEMLHRKLPLKVETEGQKLRQREISTKLKEVEDAITMFAKPRVVVKMDG